MKDIYRHPRIATVAVFIGLGGLGLAACGDNEKISPNNDSKSSKGGQFVEIQQFGAGTFKDYEAVTGVGYPLKIGQKVIVDCVASGPVEAAPSAEGKWYHIIGPDKYKDYYAAANTFENGDTSGPPSEQPAVDPRVPAC